MPKWAKTLQANFTHGEYAPEVWGRIDTKLYSSGLRHGLNGRLLPQGGIKLRPGTNDFSLTMGNVCRIAGMFYNPDEQYLIHLEPGQFWIFDAATMAQIAYFSGLPWVASDFVRLNFMSIQGTLVVMMDTFWPIRIMRHDVHIFAWDVFPFEFSPDGVYCYMPYYKFAPAPVTVKPSAVGPGNITLTTNGPFWSTHHSNITAQGQHVHISITYPADPVQGTQSQTFIGLIQSVTDNLNATVKILGTKPLPNLQPQVQWREQAMSPVWGYMRCVGFHDQRLIFAGHPYAPGFFTASQVGAPYNFDIGTGKDNEAIWVVISTESSNQIRGVLSGHHLTIFTSQGPFYYPGSETSPLTPGNISFRRTAAAQCAWTMPVFYDLAAMYVQRRGGHIRELMYDLYKQAYTADATTLLAAHLVYEPTQLAILEPNASWATPGANQTQYMIALNANGTMACYLGDRTQEISGWVPWTTGVGASVLAIGGVGEYFFICVNRTRNGITQASLERLDSTLVFDACDGFTTTTPKTVWTVGTKWANTLVDIQGDGYYMGQATVSAAGILTLPPPYSAKNYIIIGFQFPINWETMAIDQMFADGPKQGRPYSLASTVIRLNKTEAIRVNGHRMWVRLPQDPTGAPPPLYSGLREVFLNGWKTEYTVKMTLDYPCLVEVDGFNIEQSI